MKEVYFILISCERVLMSATLGKPEDGKYIMVSLADFEIYRVDHANFKFTDVTYGD